MQPYWVRTLRDSGVSIVTVTGFPFGADRAQAKAHGAELARDDGAAEIDMVVNLGALKEEYSTMVGQYREIEALLPEVKMIPSLLVQLHTASSLTGTRITRVQPLAMVNQEFYNIAPFEIEMTGTFHDFGKFTSYVANFPFIANIDNMKIVAQNIAISRDEVEGAQEVGKKKETITTTFTLSSYFVREDERLKELTL